MSDCSSIDPLITPFVDGEMPAPDRIAVESHLDQCPNCQDRVAAERRVRTLIASSHVSLTTERAPASLVARCRARAAGLVAPASMAAGAPVGSAATRVAARPPTRLRPFSWTALRARAVPLAVAATIVLVVPTVGIVWLTDRSDVLAAELAADHVKCFLMNAVLGTHHTDVEVERAMAGRFGWRAELPDHPEAVGLGLVGSRPCLYGHGRIGHVMYRHGDRDVSVFMLPGTVRAPQNVRALGHDATMWSKGNRTFVLVSRHDELDTTAVARFMQARLQ
jgi:anti-sigma factor (TIGR02949 family)